ncbi:MAG: hypothetical protein IT449_08850 [Phycisphaerales bacterium]|nr:hypothetical protein [Phycisphaerales bacterium]
MNENARTIPLNLVEQRLDDARRRIGIVDGKLADFQAERAALESEVRVLSGLIELAERKSGPVASERKPPKAAVLDYLANHPGCSSSDLIEALKDRVDSRAGDVRRNLHATLYTLKKGLKIEVRNDKLFLAKGGESE